MVKSAKFPIKHSTKKSELEAVEEFLMDNRVCSVNILTVEGNAIDASNGEINRGEKGGSKTIQLLNIITALKYGIKEHRR